MISAFLNLVREYYKSDSSDFIPLHAPIFNGNDILYVTDAIDSTYVSSVGPYVEKFEEMIKTLTGADFAIPTVNGTAALHLALHALDITSGDLVITQPLSFVATANAIKYTGAEPIFLDVDLDSMSLSAEAVKIFLEKECNFDGVSVIHRKSKKKIKAILPVHTFGNPGRIEDLIEIADAYRLTVVEDSAESIGSFVKAKHTGTFGKLGIFSFNGNKTVTCGGGGAIVTNDEVLGKRLKHLTTTAKVSHPWEYFHDEIGFNYRMPNLNAALACAQLEQLEFILNEKRKLSEKYIQFFENKDLGIRFKSELSTTKSNYWLNTIEFPNKETRDDFLRETNSNKVMTRPAWNLLNTLPMFRECITDSLTNSKFLAERLVNIPSGVKWKK